MASVFDPYHKWLGIPPREQPPTLYRLLGLQQFESDPDVIEAAANQRMAHLKTYQNGSHCADSQRLLNEVAGARMTLLNPIQRNAYDASLLTLPGRCEDDPILAEVVPIPEMPVRPPGALPTPPRTVPMQRSRPRRTGVDAGHSDMRPEPHTSMGTWIVAGLLLLLMTMCCCPGRVFDSVPLGRPSNKSAVKPNTVADDALKMANHFAEKRLTCPLTAKYPLIGDQGVLVEPWENDYWTNGWSVHSYVDSQNKFGAMTRMKYAAKLRQLDGNQWQLVGLVADE